MMKSVERFVQMSMFIAFFFFKQKTAYDMKGGLAAIMAAGAAAKKRGLRGDVIVTAVADEEYASIGTSSIVKKWHADADRKSTRLNSSHQIISYAVFCLQKKQLD